MNAIQLLETKQNPLVSKENKREPLQSGADQMQKAKKCRKNLLNFLFNTTKSFQLEAVMSNQVIFEKNRPHLLTLLISNTIIPTNG